MINIKYTVCTKNYRSKLWYFNNCL